VNYASTLLPNRGPVQRSRKRAIPAAIDFTPRRIAPNFGAQLFEIINTGSSFKFLINGVVKGTISSTMPSASDVHGTAAIVDNKNTATAVGCTLWYSTLMLRA
jgi:hypothetical protein